MVDENQEQDGGGVPLPDEQGFYGQYGGRYVPEMLVPALDELEAAYQHWKDEESFVSEVDDLLKNYSGRPTPLYFARNLSEHLAGAKIYLKQEGLGATGAHKINHCIGQAVLASRMKKKRIICETGAGQHGLATATVAARFGLPCTVYMGAEDVRRQATNVFWMRQLGATVEAVEDGTRTLKDAVNAALKDWTWNVGDTYYLLGSALGPHPYPMIVRDFQSVIGREVRAQIMEAEGRLPDVLVACVGGGSNALGLWNEFLDDEAIRLVGVEAGGRSLEPGEHACRFEGGRTGVIEGYKSYFLQNDDGQVQKTHSISAGLDYAGIGPQHAYLRDIGRVEFSPASDREVIEAFQLTAGKEGILAALESSHALAWVVKNAGSLPEDNIVVVNVSGRGDKDIFIVADAVGDEAWMKYCREYGAGRIQ
ncbi:MAG: tryptophan synthase subunit beta [Planctomycetota bacterium]|nr:tryptophan synthase subunit beta [Planctomycetota bacterium]MEE3052825.1 tryptophan synthase subunit beta [Planctomycetota bacterium]